MLSAAHRRPRRQIHLGGSSDGGLFYVFLIPCLNEERVILDSIWRLRAIDAANYAVMVIDDGSQDDTAALVRSVADERIWLYRRVAPDARQGKGEALNAATRHLLDSPLLAGRDPANVIVVILDADGSLDRSALTQITPVFRDPAVGAVQVGVRINNRGQGILARLQDIEFVIYTEVFQRGRRHTGSVGMGGNGQFVRLAALRTLGREALVAELDRGSRSRRAAPVRRVAQQNTSRASPYTSRACSSCHGSSASAPAGFRDTCSRSRC